MNDIKQALKESIKAHQQELAKLEKALAALEGTKPVPKPRGAPSAPTAKPSSTSEAAPGTPLPDRIIALLAPVEGTYKYPTGLQADDIAKELGAPIANVRTTCSRLARENRLATSKVGRTTSYLGLKAEAAPNPFAGETN